MIHRNAILVAACFASCLPAFSQSANLVLYRTGAVRCPGAMAPVTVILNNATPITQTIPAGTVLTLYFTAPVMGAPIGPAGTTGAFNSNGATLTFNAPYPIPPGNSLVVQSIPLNLQGMPANTVVSAGIAVSPGGAIQLPSYAGIVAVVDSAGCAPPAQTATTVEELTSTCPTAAEVAAFNSELDLRFDADPSAPTLVCTAAQGSADLTRLKERVYQALRIMKQFNSPFLTPLPYTDKGLYDWFTNAIHGIRFRSDIQYSFCCDPSGYINIQTNNLGILQFNTPEWLLSTMVLFMHEARHNEGYGHTCFSKDQTLQELGAWGVQYYTDAWLAFYSGAFLSSKNPMLAPTYYREWMWSDAQNTLNGAICDLGTGIVASPATLDFGSQTVNTSSSPSRAVAVTVTSGLPVPVGAVTVTGMNASDFTVGGGTCGVTSPPPSCTILVNFRPGAAGQRNALLNIPLVNGSSKTVTLTGTGVTGPVFTALRFVAVTPCRLVDTRLPGLPGGFGSPILGGGSTRDIPVTNGPCVIPPNARAYSLNVTVVPPGPLGYLTVWPSGQSKPTVSTLNAPDGIITANAAIVPAGANGAISLFASADTHVILDINGYFTPYTPFSGMPFFPLSPCRIVDTRPGAGKTGAFGAPMMAGGSTRDFPFLMGSSCLIPTGASSYSLNATVVPPGPLGYLTLWPTGVTQPVVSTLNSPAGSIVANAAIVPANGAGSISAFVSAATDLILDVNGYFGSPGTNGLSFYPVTPCRVVDTRAGAGTTGIFSTPAMGAGATRSFPVPQGGCSIPPTAVAYAVNVTVVPQGPLGYLTMWPAGIPQPTVSTLNSPSGKIVANAAIVPAGQNGAISVFASAATDVIIDINGYFAP